MISSSSTSSMTPSKLPFLTLIFLALILSPSTRADGAAEDGVEAAAVGRSDVPDSSVLKIELDQLKSKIHTLESLVDEKSRELKSKDGIIAEKEKLLTDKLKKVASLEDEISLLQKKGKMDAAEQVGKVRARAGELEKQVDKLKSDLESQQREKEALQSRLNEAEKKMQQFDSKLEKLQQINNEQKSRIRKTERALKVAEEEMMKAKFEATSKIKELSEVHGAWLPPWFASHLIQCQSFIEKHWNELGKPAMNVMIQKTTEKRLQAQKWTEPHIETIKTKWVPAVKEQWLLLTTSLEPHVKFVHTKSIEYYEASKTAITPHTTKLQQVVDPYYQEAKKFSKPYIDQVATTTKPHVDKVWVAMKPYTKKIVQAYGKFLKSATGYHKQVQASVQETLKKHELTRPLATKEFEWFAASALLALPIILLYRICSAIFCKKSKKHARHAHSNHARRKGKRGHSEK